METLDPGGPLPDARGRIRPRRCRRPAALAALCVAALAGPPRATARELASTPDLTVRLDHTLRYNLGVRTDPIDRRVGASPVFTAGEHSVRRGGISTNRLDLLSELDAAYRGRHGARVSGALWYDDAYRAGRVRRSPDVVAAGIPGTYLGDELSDHTLHRYRGPWGELLDAFVFARVDAGAVPVSLKVGRHTVSWGESLMLGGVTHGVAYAQAPLDLAKGFATPGVEAKELFRPLAAVSAQAQLTPALSLSAQVLLEWQPYLYPEGGTFLGAGDFAFEGPDGVFRRVAGEPAFLANGGAREPREAGEWGMALRWRPGWLDGAVGVVVRRYTDKFAALLLTDNPGAAGPLSPAMDSPFVYRQYYAEDVHLLGVTFAKQILGASVGAEASFRRDTPLAAQTLGFAVPPAPPLAAALFPGGAPRLVGNSYQARGDTLHAVVNAVGIVTAPLVDSASWAVELTWSRWLEVRQNRDLFFGEGFGVCRDDPALVEVGLARTRADGCATRQHVAVGAGFTPTWFRALPSVDLLAPLAVSWTVRGNSPVSMGGNEDSGTYSLGVAADVRNAWRLELRYVDFFGRTRDDGAVLTSANGQLALLGSRGSVTFTAKATF